VPALVRPWLLRGTVTSTTAGAKAERPCHQAAVKPLPVAWGPYAHTAARILAASVKGRSCAK
jgi:hypothetical protein